MITPHRPNRMSGYRQEIVNSDSIPQSRPIHHISKNVEDSTPVIDDSIAKVEETTPNISVEENWLYDGKQIQSFNSSL